MSEFIWPIRVYYEDTDSGGVVYHANYIKFMERARTEWLRSLALEQDEISDEYGIIFAIHSLSIRYVLPALFNEQLLVKTTVEKITRVSIAFSQDIVRQDKAKKEQVIAQGNVKVVSLDRQTKKPKPLPKQLYENMLG